MGYLDTMVRAYAECALWSTHNELFDTSPCDNCGERLKSTNKGWVDPHDEAVKACKGDPGGQHQVLNPEKHSESLNGDYGVDDIDPETMAEMVADCNAFRQSAGRLLDNIEAPAAGHDFWLTREGHGAGFWDRGLGKIGDELTKLAKPYGDFNLWADPATGKVRSN